MTCSGLDPDCSNTPLGMGGACSSPKLESCTVARTEEMEIQALLSFVSSECAQLAQHNVPAVSLPFPSLHPLSMCLRGIRSISLA